MEIEGLRVKASKYPSETPLALQSLESLKHSATQEMERIFQLQDLIPSFNQSESVEIQEILDKFWSHQRICSHTENPVFWIFLNGEWFVGFFFWWWLRKHRKQRRKTVYVIEIIFPEYYLQTRAPGRVGIDTISAPRSFYSLVSIIA